MTEPTRARIASGMRPTGPLHLGHYFGVLDSWIALQKEYECFFFVADWHALTTEYSAPAAIPGYAIGLVKDWISAGLDPDQCVIFQQSKVKTHAEMHLLLSMITPLGWLERNPTYKEMRAALESKDLNTYGFLGYPVLMASDILIYRPQWVPVGEDQLPHLELTREIGRRFNFIYGDFFPDPQAKLTKAAKCPGLDGRKMSKSYGNSIGLAEPMDSVKKKIMSMLTDTNRMRKSDPGNPDICNLFPYHVLLTPADRQPEIRQGCTTASWGCVDCKKLLLEYMGAFLEPIHARRANLDKDPALVEHILEQGRVRALEASTATLDLVHDKMGFGR